MKLKTLTGGEFRKAPSFLQDVDDGRERVGEIVLRRGREEEGQADGFFFLLAVACLLSSRPDGLKESGGVIASNLSGSPLQRTASFIFLHFSLSFFCMHGANE